MVRAHHADKGDAMDIVPLGDHLRAYQQINLPAVQPSKQVLHVEPVTDGIAVHAADASMRKELLQTLFALLGTSAEVKQVLALTFGTSFGYGFNVSAIVALEPLTGRTGN